MDDDERRTDSPVEAPSAESTQRLDQPETPDVGGDVETRQQPATTSASPYAEASSPRASAEPAASPAAPNESTVAVAEPEGTAAASHESGKGGASFLKELPFLILVALGLALLIKAFLVQAFFIPSGSMEHTLEIGDRVLVNKLVYDFRDIHRGEIVVFKGPPSWAPEVAVSMPTNPVQRFFRTVGGWFGFAPPGEKDFIKRVIGVAGDRVACCDSNGRVTVNGHPLTEPYLLEDNHEPFGPVTVPKGRLWVMGDHRGASADSRAHIGDAAHGTIPTNNVIGRAFVKVWPVSDVGLLSVPKTFHQNGLVAAAPYAAGVLGAAPLAVARRRRRR